MPSLTKDFRLPEVHLPEFDRQSFEMPDVDRPRIDLSGIEMPTVDVGKAITGAATAVGLVKPRRSRWPFVLGAGIVVAVAGLTAMNSTAVRERLGRARTWIDERLTAMRTRDEARDPVAFTAAETRPIERLPDAGAFGVPMDDYPEGLGASTEAVTANSR
jgi:hypothetical protein